MSEIRFDPVVEEYVVYAPDRLHRPQAFRFNSSPSFSEIPNPFGVGNESKTPGEVFAIRQEGTLPNRPGWDVRVIPNLYPAFRKNNADQIQSEGHPFFELIKAEGGHEVIVETSNPDRPLSQGSPQEWIPYFHAIQNRFAFWEKQPGIRSVFVFKNSGSIAGASLPHPHSQLVAMPMISPIFQKKALFERFYFEKEKVPYQDRWIAAEMELHQRIVWKGESVVAFCPYVSRFPFETVLLPRKASVDFSIERQEVLKELSEALKSVLNGIEGATRLDFPYNFGIYQPPQEYRGIPGMRWSLSIYPRVGGVAGFEVGTGMWMNSVYPEYAAQKIRQFGVSHGA